MLAALKRASAARTKSTQTTTDEAEALDTYDAGTDVANIDDGSSLPESQPDPIEHNEGLLAGMKEPFDINGLRQTGLYTEESIQDLLAGIPPELVYDSGDSRMTSDLNIDAKDGLQPRLFARLPKRRRLESLNAKAEQVALLDTDADSSASKVSSPEFDVALDERLDTLNDSETTPTEGSNGMTPAYVEDDANLPVIISSGLPVRDGPFSDLGEDDASEDLDIQEKILPLTKRSSKPVKKRLDPNERKEMYADKKGSEEDADGAQVDIDVNVDMLLGERINLLSLEDIQNLVRGIAEGNSIFGGAGLVAAVAGMGLYEHPSIKISTASHDKANLGLPRDNGDLEEFAKLAQWATTFPKPLSSNGEYHQHDNFSPEGLGATGEQGQSTLSDADAAQTTGPQTESTPAIRSASMPAPQGSQNIVRQSSSSSAISYESLHQGRSDAFDANDRERWAYQEAKFASISSNSSSAIIGSANSKKRKVPMLAAQTNFRRSPVASRRGSTSGQAYPIHEPDGIDDDLDLEDERVHAITPSSRGGQQDPLHNLVAAIASAADVPRRNRAKMTLSSLDPSITGPQSLLTALQSLTASMTPPAISQRMRPGHFPSSYTFRQYASIKHRKKGRFPIDNCADFSLESHATLSPLTLLPLPPTSAVHVEPTAASQSAPMPMTAKRAAKAAKRAARAKASSSLSSTNVANAITVRSVLVTPHLRHFYPSLNETAAKSEAASVVPDAEPPPSTSKSFSHSGTAFTFSWLSQRYQTELEALHWHRHQLLTLLRLKRKENLLRRKQELEAEKERLSRVLAEEAPPVGRYGTKAASSRHQPPVSNAHVNQAQTALPAASKEGLSAGQKDAEESPSLKTPVKKGKKKRSAYANANNLHHRQNYVPSRFPSSASPHQELNETERAGLLAGGAVAGEPPAHLKTDVFDLASDEWMCLFCEYELWYGTRAQIAKCVKKRKKVLKIRQKAQDRAKGAVDGTYKKATGTSSAAYKSAAAAETKAAPKTALPGTQEQADKADRAEPTPAPPPSPEQHVQDMSKDASSSSVSQTASASTDAKSILSFMDGIGHATLLSYHCLAKGMPLPIYHTTEMWAKWQSSEVSARGALDGKLWRAISVELNGDIYKRAILANERRKLSAAGIAEDAPPMNVVAAKEDIAERVLRYLLAQEVPQKSLDGYLAKTSGIVIYRPGETEFVVNLQDALNVYKSGFSLLQEYCRLDGREQPSFITEHMNDKYVYSLIFEDQKLVIDFGEAEDARQEMSLQILDLLQQQKSTKLSALIAKSKEDTVAWKAEAANLVKDEANAHHRLGSDGADSLNDID